MSPLEHSSSLETALRWLDQQSDTMLKLLIQLCDQNSGTFNATGVSQVADILQQQYQGLGDHCERQATPPACLLNDLGQEESFPLGPNLLVEARPNLARRFFLCIHMDTVFDEQHPFQKCRISEPGILNGPGVIDAKGGQVVMLYALRAFEMTMAAKNVGWRVFMNPDEEIGSLGSTPRLLELARDCELGLLFEPVLPDGSMVAARKGSGNFTIVCRGQSAHSGRDFHAGRNAVVHLAKVLIAIDQLNSEPSDVTYNVGRVQGGGPVNMVPDLAVARLNIRAQDPQACDEAVAAVQTIIDQHGANPDYQLQLDGVFSSPPKVVDSGTVKIQQVIQRCASSLQLPLSWRDTGGASDGNKLSGIGIPNVDTLGPVGNHLHSSKEFLVTESLVQRAKLAAAVLHDLAVSQPL